MAKINHKNRTLLEHRLTKVETELRELKEDIKSIKDNHLGKINDKIDEIEKKLLNRPHWLVTTIITFQFGLITALLVYILR